MSIHDPKIAVDDWQAALKYLKDGNKRFVGNKLTTRRTNEQDRNALKDGQKPFAAIVTCSDSRVPPEIFFDQKLGCIFVVRNAGNIADTAALGSIEYAVAHLHVPLIVVVGHTCCGAVTAACADGGGHPDNLQAVLDSIREFVKGSDGLESAICDNVAGVAGKIKNDEIIRKAGTQVLGACYDIETGEVSWLE